MPSLYLNTFEPLVATPAGLRASTDHGLPPFIDGSIRREPDLEHPRPSISCLCRGDKFAPRLREGDVVAYMTKKARHGGGQPHRRLVAVLRVLRLFETHGDAAAWYRGQGMSLPSNCMVEGNPPNPVSRSHRKNDRRNPDDDVWTRRWDKVYQHRAACNGRFVSCQPLWWDVGWSAPRIHDEDLLKVFGKVPGTHNPGALPISRLWPLLERLRIDAPLCRP